MSFHLINGRLYEERGGAYHPVEGVEPDDGAGPVVLHDHVPEKPGQRDRGTAVVSQRRAPQFDNSVSGDAESPVLGVSGRPDMVMSHAPRLSGYRRNPLLGAIARRLAGAPRLQSNQAPGGCFPHTGGDIVVSKQNTPRPFGVSSGGDRFNMGTNYSRGDGFDDKKGEWDKFNRYQQAAGKDLLNAADKYSIKADKLDQQGKEGADRLRQAADLFRRNAANLLDTSPNAPKANLAKDDREFFEARRKAGFGKENPDSQAFTTMNGSATTFRRSPLGIFGSRGPDPKWIIGHEGFHTLGLIDQEGPNGVGAYINADNSYKDAFDAIRGTPKELKNPDSLMGWVYPWMVRD